MKNKLIIIGVLFTAVLLFTMPTISVVNARTIGIDEQKIDIREYFKNVQEIDTYMNPIIGGSLLLFILGFLVLIGIPRILANSFLYPNPQPLVKNPGDYGMTYEEVIIETDDGVSLACWLMKGTGDDVIVIGHPATFTRYGYSLEHEGVPSGYNRDVEFIPTAKHLVDAGYSVLMFDMRNHGESSASPNEGLHDPVEAHLDTIAVTRYVSEHPEFIGKDIGLLSFCQSSFVSMVAMSEDSESLEDDGVKAFVAIQPISIEIFFKNFGIPNLIINRIKQIYVNNGVNMDDQNPLLYAKDVFVPTLFVQSIEDPWSDIDHSEEIYNMIPTEKEAIWIEGEMHRFDTYNWFNDNPEPLLGVF